MLGIEPCKSVAKLIKGYKNRYKFFDKIYAKKNFTNNTKGDLVIANNVPDIKSFVKGITYIIKNNGYVQLISSVSNLIKDLQFDTIYHEHSYLSLNFVKLLFSNVNMRLFNVDEIPTHGGSYRAYFCLENAKYQTSPEGRTFKRRDKIRH